MDILRQHAVSSRPIRDQGLPRSDPTSLHRGGSRVHRVQTSECGDDGGRKGSCDLRARLPALGVAILQVIPSCELMWAAGSRRKEELPLPPSMTRNSLLRFGPRMTSTINSRQLIYILTCRRATRKNQGWPCSEVPGRCQASYLTRNAQSYLGLSQATRACASRLLRYSCVSSNWSRFSSRGSILLAERHTVQEHEARRHCSCLPGKQPCLSRNA